MPATVNSNRVAVALAILLLTNLASLRAADVNGDGLETILLPLAFHPAYRSPGALGTVWSGAVWIHNQSGEELFPHCPGMVQCGPGVSPGYLGILPLSSLRGDPDRGLLLQTPAVDAERVTLSNRIFEVTRRGQPRGVQIPVVREGSFSRGTTVLPGVPVGWDVRVAIRVYDPLIQQISRVTPPLEQVEVEVLDERQSVLATTRLRPELLTGVEPRTRPGLAAIYDLGAVSPDINLQEHVHVRLRSIPADAEYYAMISVTDNETQTVSIITAQ